MNDIGKDRVKRLLQKLGIRLLKAKYYKFPFDYENYQELQVIQRPIIFDVGANIGQSAIWLAHTFPSAIIHAFEPFKVIFDRLQREVQRFPQVRPHQLALSSKEASVEVRRVETSLCQTNQLFNQPIESGRTEIVQLTTLDAFCSKHSIDHIHILKTDTEGHELELLAGATSLLVQRRIQNILAEVSILPLDSQHTALSEINALLSSHEFNLHSFFDLHHRDSDGALLYFNALFKLRGASASTTAVLNYQKLDR